jgi:hypothetical protein
MTKQQRRARIREVQKELLAKMQKKFPRIELVEVEERPDGGFSLHLYAPYADKFAILRTVSSRVVELLDEGLFVLVIPHSEKPVRQAA